MRETGNDSIVEIVVTAPMPLGAELTARAGVRTTVGALTELIASARQHVVIGAPFIQGNEGLHAGPLGMALAAALRRGVRIDVVSTGAALAELDFDRLREIPGACLRTYQPKDNIDDPRSLGCHAKFCVSDAAHAYLGSANITQNGMFGHIEMGVLLHGKPAAQVFAFIRALLDGGYLVEYAHA